MTPTNRILYKWPVNIKNKTLKWRFHETGKKITPYIEKE